MEVVSHEEEKYTEGDKDQADGDAVFDGLVIRGHDPVEERTQINQQIRLDQKEQADDHGHCPGTHFSGNQADHQRFQFGVEVSPTVFDHDSFDEPTDQEREAHVTTLIRAKH